MPKELLTTFFNMIKNLILATSITHNFELCLNEKKRERKYL